MGKNRKRSRDREEEKDNNKRLRRLEKMVLCLADTITKAKKTGKFNRIIIKSIAYII